MTNAITQEPIGYLSYQGNTIVRIRQMTRSEKDCTFVSELKVDEMKDKYIHATSKGSLNTIKRIMLRNHTEQEDWFFERNFIADYHNEDVGILTLMFPEDPELIQSDLDMEFGCTDQCGLSCLSRGLDETIPDGSMYIKHIYVLERFRNKGIGEELLIKAENEAKRENKTHTMIIYSTGSANLSVTAAEDAFSIGASEYIPGFYKRYFPLCSIWKQGKGFVPETRIQRGQPDMLLYMVCHGELWFLQDGETFIVISRTNKCDKYALKPVIRPRNGLK